MRLSNETFLRFYHSFFVILRSFMHIYFETVIHFTVTSIFQLNNPFATDNTLLCGWNYEHGKLFNESRKCFFCTTYNSVFSSAKGLKKCFPSTFVLDLYGTSEETGLSDYRTGDCLPRASYLQTISCHMEEVYCISIVHASTKKRTIIWERTFYTYMGAFQNEKHIFIFRRGQ